MHGTVSDDENGENITTNDNGVDQTRYEPPERDGIYWGGNERTIDQLRVVGQIGTCGDSGVEDNTVAWIISGLNPYIDSRTLTRVDIPSTYTKWMDEFGDGDGLYRGQVVLKDDEHVQMGITAKRAMAALRTLTGGGHYNEESYRLYDCYPIPVLRGPEGAVAIAPVEIRKK